MPRPGLIDPSRPGTAAQGRPLDETDFQDWREARQPNTLTGARFLQQEVLHLALADLGSREHRAEAAAWLLDTEADGHYSSVGICDAFGIDHAGLRRYVTELLESGMAPAKFRRLDTGNRYGHSAARPLPPEDWAERTRKNRERKMRWRHARRAASRRPDHLEAPLLPRASARVGLDGEVVDSGRRDEAREQELVGELRSAAERG